MKCRNLIVLLLVLVFNLALFSQKKHCDSPKKNNIGVITKCAIKSWKENSDSPSRGAQKFKRSKQISLIVSRIRRSRIERKREAVGSINNLEHKGEVSGINETKNELKIENTSKEEFAFSFESIERAPAFPECKNASNGQMIPCFNKEIAEHIKKEFNYPKEALKRGVEGRVYVQFIIDKFGQITDVQSRGPRNGKILEKEAERIIAALPKLQPAKDNGKPVKSKYFMPIVFKLPEGYEKMERRIKKSTVISFARVDEIPRFDECKEESGDSEEALDCFNQEMIRHVQENFTYPEQAYMNNIEGRVWVYFVINKKGEVVDINATTPNNERILEEEAKRVISRLPVFYPGKEKNAPVDVRYGMPINFELE